MQETAGKTRVCVNYRRLNEVTVLDPYPQPYMEDLLHLTSQTNRQRHINAGPSVKLLPSTSKKKGQAENRICHAIRHLHVPGNGIRPPERRGHETATCRLNKGKPAQ